MKCKIFYLLFFIAAYGQAQVIAIPDVNFKNALLAASTSNYIALDSSDEPVVIDANANGAIEVSEVEDIRVLNIPGLYIANLEGIQYFTDLRELDCSQNVITSFNAALNADLRYLYCQDNMLTSLTIAGLDHLMDFKCSGNMLTALDFTGLEYLTAVDCSGNNLTQLDFSGCPALTDFSCSNNDITFINIKNGQNQGSGYSSNYWQNNPLQYICTDDSEVDAVNVLLGQNGYTGVNVNTYCSFVPGGDYNTIAGGLIFDADNNGCGPGDVPHCFVKLALYDGVSTTYTFTDETGNYNFYTQDGDFTVTPDFENETFFTASPASADVDFQMVDNAVATEDFCVTANGVQSDVEVVMVPISKAVPGMNASYKIVYKNKGNTTVSGAVSCAWDTDIIDTYANFSPTPNVVVQDYYLWNYYDLKPFESREINMVFKLKNTFSNPSINVGDTVPFVAEAGLGGNTDVIDQDNTFTFNQKIEAAYQGNYMICVEGDTAPASAIGDYLHYAVNFANTGTDTASNVVITQEFDPAQFDISTLEILNTSHNAVARVSNNMAQFIMEGANVVGGNGHGNILIKIKTRTSVQANTSVTGQAAIHFDYAAPMQTNSAVTTFQVLSAGGFEKDLSVMVYPNPAANVVKITADSLIKAIELYDIQGRLLEATMANNTTAQADLSSRASGIYFVKVITEKGIKVEKLIKQ